MKYMRYYETLYLIRPDLDPETYKSVVEKYNKIIEENKGIITKVEEWGKKELAYEVEKFKDGFYVLVRFCGDADLPEKLQRDFRLDERVLKFIVIKLKDRVNPEELKQDISDEDAKKKEVKAENGSK